MKRGFTLIELLVVIAIIGLLSSVIFASLNTTRAKSRDARRKADIQQVSVAVEFYFDENNVYPIAGGPGPACSSWIYATGQLQTANFSKFMSVLPKDPLGGTEYLFLTPDYSPGPASGNYFVILARLENPSSQDSSNYTNFSNSFSAKWPSCAGPLGSYNFFKGIF